MPATEIREAHFVPAGAGGHQEERPTTYGTQFYQKEEEAGLPASTIAETALRTSPFVYLSAAAENTPRLVSMLRAQEWTQVTHAAAVSSEKTVPLSHGGALLSLEEMRKDILRKESIEQIEAV